MRKAKKVETRPVIPLRDMVVFPHAKVPFIVGRSGSVEAVKAALAGNREVFLVMQRDPDLKEPAPRDLHAVGSVGRIVHDLVLPDGNYKLLVEGLHRARVASVVKDKVHLQASVVPLQSETPDAAALAESSRRLAESLEELVKSTGGAGGGTGLEQLSSVDPKGDGAAAADAIVARLSVAAEKKQEYLEVVDELERVRQAETLVRLEIEKLGIERKLQREVQRQVEQAQRDYLLGEKMKAIQKELGRKDHDDTEQLRARVEDAGLPEAAEKKAFAEIDRLEGMAPMSAEATVIRTYLDWLLAVPWTKRSRERRDFKRAAQVLEEDHHGLEKVKERILEFLAVRTLKKGRKTRGSILCLVGPPGVGKTSLGRSIAGATGREFVRLSLGGVRDEAEIRGHRRTYIGAYPGRIIQMMKKAGTRNPVFLLDEIDKMSADFRGDPSAALLEVLDPAQNESFLDHYLDTEYDLSEVLFLCTANVLHTIPAPLQDRLETIRLPGYTLQEKRAIATRFLLPRQVEGAGIPAEALSVGEEALDALIERYTREAGVRQLEREIGSLCRKVARRRVEDEKATEAIETLADVQRLLGAPRFRPAAAERESEVGVATGLAWTEAGGQLLLIEATTLPGKGELLVTGRLGDVMQESLRAAVSYVRARHERFGLSRDFFRDHDVHVHVPEGGIPKDGPSAGITLAAAVVSAVTGRRVRHDVAMTGEITLRGRVLPVGGIKEKLLAAHRAGIRHVMLPVDCERELDDVPTEVREEIEITLVEDMDGVLALALLADDGEGDRPATADGDDELGSAAAARSLHGGDDAGTGARA